MRFLLSLLIVSFILGCGVDTDSSDGYLAQDTNTSGDQTDFTDDNTTNDDLGDSNEDQSKSDFDTRSAIKDQNACILNDANAMEDSSFDPTGTVDEENGMVVSSLLRYDADVEKTKVVVYYPDLTVTPVGTQITLYGDYYRLSFDQAWPTNDQNTIYVRIPRGIESNYYGCMRYILSVNNASIEGQRVYRVNE